MIITYTMSAHGLHRKKDGSGDVLVLKDATANEMHDIIKHYRLPQNIFQSGDQAEEVTRFEQLEGTELPNAYVLVLMDIAKDTEWTIERRLQPLTIIKSDHLLIVHLNTGSNFIEDLIEECNEQLTTQAHPVGCSIYRVLTHFLLELNRIKRVIDQLDESARVTTKNQELFRLADTERLMVYIDHTLQDQRQTLDHLWAKSDIVQNMDDPRFFEDLHLRQRHIEKLVDIYRDLLETIGGLFTDMMDNNLNHLMKYLDSAGLVISIPALISGIWGMNVGGLPGEKSSLGFTIVMVVSLLLAIIASWHLATKDYGKS